MSIRLNVEFSATAKAGAELSIGPDLSTSGLVDGPIHHKVLNIAGAAAVAWQTVWEAAVDTHVATFKYGAIVVDPERRRTSEKSIHVRYTTSTGSTYTQVVSSDFPVQTICSSSLITAGVTLAKIELSPIAGGVVTTDDVEASITLWK